MNVAHHSGVELFSKCLGLVFLACGVSYGVWLLCCWAMPAPDAAALLQNTVSQLPGAERIDLSRIYSGFEDYGKPSRVTQALYLVGTSLFPSLLGLALIKASGFVAAFCCGRRDVAPIADPRGDDSRFAPAGLAD